MIFDDNFYLQVQGTAMGTIFAPTYATLTMGYHEEKLYTIIRNKFNDSQSRCFEKNWKRFLDDCFIYLSESFMKPKDLLNILNNINPAIQFTVEASDKQLPFLDIMINKENTNIFMDIFSKPTDAKRYVSFKSNHPKHCLKNIPFSLARRICMIVEKDSIKDNKLLELKHLLLKQGYPEKIITNGIEKAMNIPQSELRINKTKNTQPILPFISTFNPNNPTILPILKSTLENLKCSEIMEKALKKTKFVNCKRQAPNLERILCKSGFNSTMFRGIVEQCGKNCFCCDYISQGTEYLFKEVKYTFKIKSKFNCESKNLIYVIICSGCNKEYIGQTQTMLKERLSIYRQHIRQPQYQMIKAEGHLRTCGKGIFNIMPFFQVREDNKILRESYEDNFIKRFKPALNRKCK